MATYKCGQEAMVGDVVRCSTLGERTVDSVSIASDAVLVGHGRWLSVRCFTLIRRAADTVTATTDQQLIAAKFDQLKELCLRKNADYGSNFAAIPCLAPGVKASDAVLVRMSDKIARLQSLLAGKSVQVDESIADTVSDLSVYGILYLIAREKEASK